MYATSGIWGLPIMDATTKVQATKGHGAKFSTVKRGFVRVCVSAALVSVMLGACTSVPDAINPVSWYEKTTDFFSGDSQAAENGTQSSQETANGGLVADPDAPPPAESRPEQVASAPSGLSADSQAAGNYASPPIERQGAASNVLKPESQMAEAPPVPSAAPMPPVTSAPMPVQPSAMPSTSPQTSPPMTSRSVASPMPSQTPEQQYAAVAPSAPPAPFEFPPTNAADPYAAEEFDTVVITADGMESMPQSTRRMSQSSASMAAAPSSIPMAPSSALFPEPGATTSGDVGPAAMGGMLRVATIHFANNAANLDSRDRSILGAVIQLHHERGGRVVVVGHASARTKDMDYIQHQMVNFEISMQRATAIGAALKGLGLQGEDLEVQAVSDTQPLFMEVMPSGEAGNRRVEIYLAGAAT